MPRRRVHLVHFVPIGALALALACASGGSEPAPGPSPAARTGAPLRLVTDLASRSPAVREYAAERAAAIRSSPTTERAARWLEWHAPGTSLADCLVVHGPGTGRASERDPSGRIRDPLELGLRDAQLQRWVEPLLADLDGLEASLPTPAGWRPSRPKLDRIEVADLVVRGGSLAGSTAPGTHLRPEEGARVDVFWRNLAAEGWFGRSVRPYAARLLAPHQRDLVTSRAHLAFYATRFATYQLGPQEAVVGDARHPVREWFREDWGPLQIAKADALGVLAHEWLIERGAAAPETSAENLTTAVAMAFYTLAEALEGEAPAAHLTACALTLSFLSEHRAIARSPDGTWEVDVALARAALRDLVATIFRIYARGARGEAAALLADRGAPSPAVRATVEALGHVPEWRGPLGFVLR